MTLLSDLIAVTSPDPIIQRRARLLAILSLGIILLSVVFLPISLLGTSPLAGVLTLAASVLVGGVSLLLARRGSATVGGWLLALGLSAAILGSALVTGALVSLYYLVIVVMVAGVVLRPLHVWWVLLINLAGMALLLLVPSNIPQADATAWLSLVGAGLLLVFVAFVAYLGGSSAERALQTSLENAQRAAEAQARAEAQAHALETQAQALAEAEQRQRDLVATLETPTVALAEGVLLAPIVGTLDSTRAQRFTARLLHDVADQHARLVVMDIAGVGIVDTAVAQAIIRTVQAVRLLGSVVVLTGIAPTVATTLTHLGVDLAGVQTARSPQMVLARLFELRDLQAGAEHKN